MTTKQLKSIAVDLSAESKAALTCLECGTARDFEGSPGVKEAMIQIDEFRREHGGCK